MANIFGINEPFNAMIKVLVTPLDWGLGHATRCIPVIQALLRRKCTVFIAGSGDSSVLLKKEFPLLQFFELPGYCPVYARTKGFMLTMARQLPKFLRVIRQEHHQVASIIATHDIDIIISDNRYGCWSAKITSVLMTHQLNILMPQGFGWLSSIVRKYNYQLVKKFSCCWVPDYADPDIALAGILTSHDPISLKHVQYIGPLSRFQDTRPVETRYDVLCILSGPEPQRSIFEDLIMPQLKTSGLRYFVVRGLFSSGNFLSANEAASLTSEALQAMISQSSMIIARSGYSTIMDLAAAGKKAIVVPTPGQTEQEYLASRWSRKRIVYASTQRSFDLKKALDESESYTGFSAYPPFAKGLLDKAIDSILDQAHQKYKDDRHRA